MQDLEWRRIKRSFRYFAVTYWNIPKPDLDTEDSEGVGDFELYEYQHELVDMFLNDRRVFVLKARQLGFTTLATAYAFWLCATRAATLAIFVSKTGDDAKEVIHRARTFGVANMPDWLVERSGVNDRATSRITFDNGSRFESGAASAQPARGKTARLVILDEWAFARDPEDAWASAMPAAEHGQVIAGSTAYGAGTFFHKQWLEAEAGLNEFRAMFLPWHSRPRPDDFLEKQARSMRDPIRLAREYPDTAEDAFRLSAIAVFNAQKLAGHVVSEPDRGIVEMAETAPQWRPFVPSVQPDDRLRVWEYPQAGSWYFIGMDVAGSQHAGDYTSIHVVSESGFVAAHWHGWIGAFDGAAVVATLGLWYNRALLIVEAQGGWGDATLESLMRDDYPNVYHEVRQLQGRAEQTTKAGFSVTPRAKKLLVENFALALAEDAIRIPCEDTINEATIYQILNPDTGSMGAPPGSHDDRITSLMLAVWGLKQVGDLGSMSSPTYEVAKMAPGWSTLDTWIEREKQRAALNQAGGRPARGTFVSNMTPSTMWPDTTTDVRRAMRSGRSNSPSAAKQLPGARPAVRLPRA